MKVLLSIYKDKVRLILFLSLVVAGAFLITVDSTDRAFTPSTPRVIAAQPDEQLCGFAWAGEGSGSTVPTRNGAGWISMNSQDCDFLPVGNNGIVGDGIISPQEAAERPGCPVCSAPGCVKTYNVNVAQGGGGSNPRQLNGYAWSSNLGWLKFGNGDIYLAGEDDPESDGYGELTGIPSVSNYSNQQARISSNSGSQPSDVNGWARFCAGTIDGTCRNTVGGVSNTRTDGWDGWLALAPDNGSPFNLQYNPNTNKFVGWSWGGEVVGWVKWDTNAENGVQYCETPEFAVSLTASPTTFQMEDDDDSFTPTLTALSNPADDTDYKFSCGYGLPFTTSGYDYSSGGDGAYDFSGCTYPIGSISSDTYYYPQVVGRREVNGNQYLYSTSTAEVLVRAVALSNGLGAECTATPNPVFVNQPATWTVRLNNPGVQGNVYNYTFDFTDGQPDPAPVVTTNREVEMVRSYRQIGNKSLTVTVVDTTAEGQPTGQCTVNTRVIIDPTIIET